MIFIIQVNDKNELMHDFAYTTLDAIRFYQWLNNNEIDYKFITYDNMLNLKNYDKSMIPIGSVQFVIKWYEKFNIYNIVPLNYKELFIDEYYKRKILTNQQIEKLNDLTGKKVFVKSIDNIKSNINGWYDKEDVINIKENILISEYINIEAEFRCFVFNNELIDVKCYSGDFKLQPDYFLIEKIISEIKGLVGAYTIDVGVGRDGTFIIELHHFFSCGLYGFSNLEKYINMAYQTHKEITNGFYNNFKKVGEIYEE